MNKFLRKVIALVVFVLIVVAVDALVGYPKVSILQNFAHNVLWYLGGALISGISWKD